MSQGDPDAAPADSAADIHAFGKRAGVIAHDFNNLLTSIRGLSSLALQELEEDHPLRPDIEEITKAAQRAAALAAELLALAREAQGGTRT